VETEAVNAEFNKTIQAFQRQARIPGFRKGKAPRVKILQSYRADIDNEVKKRLISSAYQDAVKEKDLQIIGYPDIEEIQFGQDQELLFSATVETSPSFELPEYKALPVKIEKRSVTEADVEKAITALREQRANYADVEREVKDGDFVVVNYSGTSDGQPLADIAPAARGLAEKKDFWINVQSDAFIPGFTDQLKGAKAGDKRTVEVTFPDSFAAKELQGKPGTYEVEILKVKERALPEVNDEFAKSYEAESIVKLREGVQADLERELTTTRTKSIRGQLVQGLLSKAQFDLPESVIESETRNVIYDLVRENQQRGVSQNQIEDKKDEIYAYANNSAKDRVKLGFVLSKIADAEGIKVSQEDLSQRISMLSYSYNIPVKKFVKQLRERNGIGEIHEQLMSAKTLEFIEKEANIEEVEPAPQEEAAANAAAEASSESSDD
jgi:trigger factor